MQNQKSLENSDKNKEYLDNSDKKQGIIGAL